MPEPVNPHSGMATRGAWADCDRAWRAWLASDEARDRVAAALFERWPDRDGQNMWVWADPRDVAQVALDALRGTG